jgi:predicted TPR repeat methyltransferase
MATFDAYAKYYDLTYAEKNYVEESDFVWKILQRYRPGCIDLLEFGAGTGKHAGFLKQKGLKVHGVEISQKMIELAETENFAQLFLGDMVDIELDIKFDFAFALFHVFSYLDSNRQSKFFENLSKNLNSGGIFLFDFWYKDAVEATLPEIRLKRIANSDFEFFRIAIPTLSTKNQNVRVDYSIFVKSVDESKFDLIEESHVMNYLEVSTLKRMVANHGFKLLEVSEMLTEVKPSQNTWAVCAIIQKI